jgi:hypothetical protein
VPTGHPEVDQWMNLNADLLRDYAIGKLNTAEFYSRMQPVFAR